MKRIEDIGLELIHNLKNIKDPFTTPIVVFENQSMQQWFKAFWLEKEKTVLMNVSFLSLRPFILNSFKGKNELISKSELKDYLLDYLTSNIDDLGDDFKNYIMKDDNIEVNNLYDLAQTLSNLFFDYEENKVEIKDSVQEKIYKNILDNFNTLGKTLINTEVKKYDAPIYIVSINGLSKLYINIINKLKEVNNITLFTLEENNRNDITSPINFMGAPSKIREIEYIHSKICELLKNNVDFKDILVVAPSIDEYSSAIAKVFNQSEKEGFINIPYVFSGKSGKSSVLAEGIKTLVNIVEKGFATRNDYFKLVSNSMIQRARGINNDDVDTIMRAIIKMNVYRDVEDNNDWDYSKKRMLVSKLIGQNCDYDNRCELNDGEYTSYVTIDLEDDIIVDHVRIVEDLNSLKENLSKIEFVNKKSIEVIEKEFDKWFSMKKDEDDIESNFIYKKVIDKLDYFKELSENKIPVKALYLSIIDEVSNVNASSANLFNGVTFMSFNKDIVFPTKYLFFLGLSSKNYPRTEKNSELDLYINRHLKSKEDEKGFNNYLSNVGGAIYLTYENMDLRKDEEFFPSKSVLELKIKDLEKYKKSKKAKDIPHLTIDEKRDWKELYTRSEFVKKDVYSKLTSGDALKDEDSEVKDCLEFENYPKKVKLSKIKDYLEEEFKFKASYLFGSSDDISEDIRDEYEPVESNPLLDYMIIPEVVKYMIKNKIDKLSSIEKEQLIRKWQINHDLPKEEFGVSIFNNCASLASYIVSDVNKRFNELSIPDWNDKCNVEKISDLSLKCSNKGLTQTWDLICNMDTIVSYYDNNIVCCAETKKPPSKEPSAKDYLKPYVYSLMLVASLKENEYTVYLFKGEFEKSFKLKPAKAKEILNNIYYSMFDYKNIKIRPISYLQGKVDSDSQDDITLNALLKHVEDFNNGDWSYYNDKKLFNVRKENGYSDNSKDEIIEEIRKLKELIIILED